jgi:hypothetical protein
MEGSSVAGGEFLLDLPPGVAYLGWGERHWGTTMSKCLPLLAVLLVVPSLYADEAEDKAVAAVMKLRGSVERDVRDPAHPVVSVNLTSTQVMDAGLKELPNLKGPTSRG